MWLFDYDDDACGRFLLMVLCRFAWMVEMYSWVITPGCYHYFRYSKGVCLVARVYHNVIYEQGAVIQILVCQ